MGDKVKVGPFVPANSDGCTVISKPYNWLTGKKLPFRECCIKHDEAYWYGGPKHLRKEADVQLRKCVASYGKTVLGKCGYFTLSWIMYVAVRIGGSPKLPLPWRWKFSNPYTYRQMFGGYDKDSQ